MRLRGIIIVAAGCRQKQSVVMVVIRPDCVYRGFLEGLFASLANGSLRQKQVCDALRCSGLHARYNDVRNELLPSWPDGVG